MTALNAKAVRRLHLDESSRWETFGLWLYAPGRRVRRRMGLPVFLPDALFTPRRARR